MFWLHLLHFHPAAPGTTLCTPPPFSIHPVVAVAFTNSLTNKQWFIASYGQKHMQTRGQAQRPVPLLLLLLFRAEVTRRWQVEERVLVVAALWAKPTCHRSRNQRPACSDRDPQPRRCTPAPWSSLQSKVGEEPGLENDWIHVPSSLFLFLFKSLCYCALNSAARQRSSPDNARHFPCHAKCVKVCHVPL